MSPARTRSGIMSSRPAGPGWASTGPPRARRMPGAALPALFALRAEELLEPVGLPLDLIAEDMDLGGRAVGPALDVAVDLEPCDDAERRVQARLVQRVGEPVGRVVVGDREDAHAV